MLYYKVSSPFLAVREADGHGFITVPRGAVIELRSDPPHQSLVPVYLNNEQLLVFWRDLKDRTEPVLDDGRPQESAV